jgi:heme exporter protein D
MQFESFSEFLSMGGHATFIFSVYVITAIVILFNVVAPLRQQKRFYKEQAARQRREQVAGAAEEGGS